MNNIYDNPVFFEKYLAYRRNPLCFNNTIEQPAIRSLLPTLKDKTILDLGSGFGYFCQYASSLDAQDVVGIEDSRLMYTYATTTCIAKNIKYINLSIEKFSFEQQHFDIIVSSLVLHYFENLNVILQNIYSLLKPGGTFIFSVNHPKYSSTFLPDNSDYRYDYTKEGRRKQNWLNFHVPKYHRTLETYRCALANAGLKLKQTLELNVNEQLDDKTSTINGPLFIVFSLEK